MAFNSMPVDLLRQFFSDGTQAHPLTQPKELRRMLAELAVESPARQVDELGGWLESAANADGFSLEALFNAVVQIDEAGQTPMRRFTRDYLSHSGKEDPSERKRWAFGSGYWRSAASAYGAVLAEYKKAAGSKEKPKGFDTIRKALPSIYCRRLAALAAYRMWCHFHYEPSAPGLWHEIGETWRLAEELKLVDKPLQLYPSWPGGTTITQELVQVIVLEASSPEALSPAETDLAAKLLAHFSPRFAFGRTNRSDNMYWVDVALDQPPRRLARLPTPSPTVCMVGFGEAPSALGELVRKVEMGTIPEHLALGDAVPARTILKVLRHLASYWAAKPPVRGHHRHAVQGGIRVLKGFDAALDLQSVDAEWRAEEAIHWETENVSLGGFGALTSVIDKGVAIGQVLSMQPAGGSNWLLGLVRRYNKRSDGRGAVGIETVAKLTQRVNLRVLGKSSLMVAGAGEPALLLDEPDENSAVRLLLSAGTFDLSESYDCRLGEKSALFTPIELLDSGLDYQVARYRLRYAG